MKRKEYLKPEMKVVQLKSRTQLLTGSTRKMRIIYDDEVDDDDYIL